MRCAAVATLGWMRLTYLSDGSGILERKEVSRLLVKVGRKLTQKQIDAAMDEIDRDGSGCVSFLEFERWATRNGRLIAANSKNTGHVPFVQRAASLPLLPRVRVQQ